MELLLVLGTAFVCVCCFIIGAKVGQTVSKGEDIEMPSISPLKAHREREARKEAQRAQDRVDTILQNIDNYDGTAQGQKDVPRG
jgi:hypothetical protein